MKRCDEIEQTLTAYLEELLTEEEKKPVEEHLATCLHCAKTLEELGKAKAIIGTLEEVEAPPWLTAKIMSRIHEEKEGKEGFFRKIFFPLHIKIPIEAFATILVVALSVYLLRTTTPDIKTFDHPSPGVKTSAPGPAPGGKNTPQAPVKKKLPAGRPVEDLKKYAAPDTGGPIAKSSPKEMPPGASLAETAAAPSFAGKDEPPALRDSAKKDLSEKRANDTFSFSRAQPYPSAERTEKTKTRSPTAKEEKDKSPAPALKQRAGLGDSRETRSRITVLTSRPDEIAQEVRAILHSLEGTEIEEKKRGAASVVIGRIDAYTLDQLRNRLEKIGIIDESRSLVSPSTNSVIVEIVIFKTRDDQDSPSGK